MAHTKSAVKRHRQSEERRVRNRARRSMVKTQIKRVRDAVAVGDFAKAETEFRTAVKKIDQVASSGTIHKNAAARLKSRLSAHVKRGKAGAKS